MRKFVTLILLMAITLSVGSLTNAATDDLTALAEFYDDDMLVFAGIRTDEALLNDLDTLASQISLFLPAGMGFEAKPSVLLEQQLAEMDIDLEADILPWLGDAAAFGLSNRLTPETDFDSEPPILIAASVNGPKALAYFETLLAPEVEGGDAVISQENGFTVYSSSADSDVSTVLAFGDDVLLLGIEDTVTLGTPENPLSADADFNAAIAALPADDYAALLYADFTELQSTLLALSDLPNVANTTANSFNVLNNAADYIAFGVTALDERTLVVDTVQQLNLSVYEEIGYTPFIPRALDPAFVARVPEDAIGLVHGSEFGPSLINNLDSLRALGSFLQENGGFTTLADPTGLLLGDLPPAQAAFVESVDLGALTGVLNIGFAGFTGISLERDFLPVLDGDAALFLRVQDAENFFLSPVLPDLGFVVNVSDAAAAQGLITSFDAAARAYDADYALEEFGAGQALAINLIEQALGFPAAELDILIGADDDVFVLGTRNAALRSLEAEGGLATDPTYMAAQAHFVTEPQTVLYLNPQPVSDLVIDLVEQGELPGDETVTDVLRVLSLVESASISSRIDAAGLQVGRTALTLGTQPNVVTFSNDLAMAD